MYGDKALDVCRDARLPEDAEPFIFPRVAERHDIGIASPLMEAIRQADFLVYLDTPESLGRSWVGFERSYAARLGKPVYAFRPDEMRGLFGRPFTRDMSPAIDPLVSLLVNLQVDSDVAGMQAVLAAAQKEHNILFGGSRLRADDAPRHLLDSVDDMESKLKAGAIALLFLSTASVESGWHDYADAYTAMRAKKDFDSPTGYTSRRFAALPPERTLVVWLDRPDPARIEAALSRFDPNVWTNYIATVRAAANDPMRCAIFGEDGNFDRVQLDNLIARAHWQALQGDPVLAQDFRAELRGQKRRKQLDREVLGVRPITDRPSVW
jgi:hypothetical protein